MRIWQLPALMNDGVQMKLSDYYNGVWYTHASDKGGFPAYTGCTGEIRNTNKILMS